MKDGAERKDTAAGLVRVRRHLGGWRVWVRVWPIGELVPRHVAVHDAESIRDTIRLAVSRSKSTRRGRKDRARRSK